LLACKSVPVFLLHHETALNVGLTKPVDFKLQNIKTVFCFRLIFCKKCYLSVVHGNTTASTLKESVATYLEGKAEQHN
jgi:hypothetical protein